MKCKAYKLTILMTLVLSMIWVQTGGAAVMSATDPTVKMSLNGEVLNLPGYGDGLALRQGTAFIQLYSLMVILEGNLKWDENTLTATAQYMDKKIQFKINSDECITDGQTIKLGYSTFAYHNRLMVPLRSVCEIFGIKLDWDALNQTVNLDVPGLLNSERLYNPAIPAQIAFINHGHLYIMDGSQPGSTPVLINRKGENEIIGWSADGQWLAYLNSPVRYSFSGEQYLWVVKANGSQATQLDSRLVFNNMTSSIPKWSPLYNSIAFVARKSGDSYDCIPGVNISSYKGGKWILRNISASDKNDSVSDLAWAPDGQSLAVSLPAQNNKGMRIERISLSGQSSILLGDMKTRQQDEANYLGIYAASGMKWSPDGRYLAYYLCPQSASTTCDETNLQILDTHSTDSPIDLGCGLAYSDWLAWSHDSTKFAYIKGSGREAFTNKKLVIADLGQNKPKFTECTPSGQVDVQPMWVPDSNTLLFCRGADNEKFDYTGGEFMVPGQSIWQRSASGEMKAVSSGSPESADYAPTISDDSQNLIYLHLNEKNKGSLYLRNITADKIGSSEHKIVELCGGSVGFYGNYLPRWFSVYWTAPAAGGESNISSNNIQALRGEYFEFGIKNRLDYIPMFDEGEAPSSSAEYLLYAFAINLDNWGADKGIMTRDYVEQVIQTHFEVENISHGPLPKVWNYDGEKYTAIPQGIKDRPIYVLEKFDTYKQNGQTIYEITLDNCNFGDVRLGDEDMSAIKASIVSGDLSALTVLQTECVRYYLNQTTGEVVFLSHTLAQEQPASIE